MNIDNENDDVECAVCREPKVTIIPLITCTHKRNFCEQCIKNWLKTEHYTCPLCRENFPVADYVS